MSIKEKILISTVNNDKFDELKSIFEKSGAKILNLPMIEIVCSSVSPQIKEAIRNIDSFDWILFTSTNGVDFFNQIYFKIARTPVNTTAKIGVIGTSTAKALEKYGLKADFTGSGNTSDDFAKELIQKGIIQNQNILLPLGNLAKDSLQSQLSDYCSLSRIDVYETRKPSEFNQNIIQLIIDKKYDLIIFTSPSAIDNYVEVFEKKLKISDLKIACIGKVTANAAEKYGLKSLITAGKSSYEGLAEEITQYYKTNT